MKKLINKILFNLSHWCLNYEDYQREMDSVEHAEMWQKIHARGYMEKSDLAFFFAHPTCEGVKKQEVRTSGSTGSPIRFWCDSGRIASSLALVDYRFKQLGLRKDDVFMKFWYPTTGHTLWQLLKEKLFRWHTKERFFSYFDLVNKTKTFDDVIGFIRENKPDFVEGYAGGLIALAAYIKEHKIELPKIRTMVTGAGMVTDQQHKLIEEAFGCQHYNRYGCSEFGEIAHKIGGELYEQNPFLHIEVSKDLKTFHPIEKAKNGEYEIFVSDSRNICTPFWRYRMHDVIKVKDGKIAKIIGRTEKVYEIADGEFLPTGFFYQAVKDFTDIVQWQVEIDPKTKTLILRTNPRELNLAEKHAFEKYFGKNKFRFLYESGNFTTVGRREKMAEIIVHAN